MLLDTAVVSRVVKLMAGYNGYHNPQSIAHKFNNPGRILDNHGRLKIYISSGEGFRKLRYYVKTKIHNRETIRDICGKRACEFVAAQLSKALHRQILPSTQLADLLEED